MTGSVLIGYATRTGAARDIAIAASETLAAAGRSVRVADLRDQPDLDGAELVILGSGIQAGHWYPEATAWLAANSERLRGRRVVVYNACLNAVKPEKRADSLAYNRAIQERTGAESSQTFAGRFVPAKVGFFRRTFLHVLQQEPRDHLDLAAVRSWAESLV